MTSDFRLGVAGAVCSRGSRDLAPQLATVGCALVAALLVVPALLAQAGRAQDASPTAPARPLTPPPPVLIDPSATPRGLAPAALEIAEAERAFAADGVAKGIRESFYAWFAEDGIGYDPHPHRTREAIRARPPQSQRPPVTLDWEPVFVDAAASGDLGLSTGPSVFSDQSEQRRPPGYGYYFSVWRRQADGSWRVENDFGTPMPEFSLRDLRLGGATVPSVPPRTAPDPAAAEAELLARDRELGEVIAARGYAAALDAATGPDARLHRPDAMPVLGREAIRAYLEAHDSRPRVEPIDAGASRAGDLGYVYGRWSTPPSAGSEATSMPAAGAANVAPAAATGYYLRVWKRFGDGWKVVADITNSVGTGG